MTDGKQAESLAYVFKQLEQFPKTMSGHICPHYRTPMQKRRERAHLRKLLRESLDECTRNR
jgi:hypothetical protein